MIPLRRNVSARGPGRTVALLGAAALSWAGGGPLQASSVFSPEWTGFYLGGSIGARKDTIDWTALNAGALSGAQARASLEAESARLGAFAGANFQLGRVVVGVEGDVAWGKGSRLGIDRLIGFPAAAGDQMTIETNVDGSLRLRAGVLMLPTLLLYGTGGIVYGDVTLASTLSSVNVSPAIATSAKSSTVMLGRARMIAMSSMAW